MRFEGKHAYFKELAKKIKNFKNIPYSLAQKNQKVVCAEHMNVDGKGEFSPLFGHEIALGKNNGDLEAAKASIARFFPITDGPAEIRLCNSVTIKLDIPDMDIPTNWLYRTRGLPEFSSLVKIWYVSDASVCFVSSYGKRTIRRRTERYRN